MANIIEKMKERILRWLGDVERKTGEDALMRWSTRPEDVEIENSIYY